MREAGLTPALCRAARSAAGLSQMRLAELANVSRPVVQDFEAKGRVPIGNNLIAIRAALEAAGVRLRYPENGEAAIFFPDNADEPGAPGGED